MRWEKLFSKLHQAFNQAHNLKFLLNSSSCLSIFLHIFFLVYRIIETLKKTDPELIQMDEFKNEQLLCLPSTCCCSFALRFLSPINSSKAVRIYTFLHENDSRAFRMYSLSMFRNILTNILNPNICSIFLISLTRNLFLNIVSNCTMPLALSIFQMPRSCSGSWLCSPKAYYFPWRRLSHLQRYLAGGFWKPLSIWHHPECD